MEFDIKRIIDEMPDNLSDIEKVRYMYIKCGERFSYNTDYTYITSKRNSKRIYEKGFKWKKFKNQKDSRINLTCNQIVLGCIESINMLNQGRSKKGKKINAKRIGYEKEKQNHVAILVEIDGKSYVLDLYHDLYRIQNGMKTRYFTPCKELLEKEKNNNPAIKRDLKGIKCNTISDKDLFKMDKKINYLKCGIYMNGPLEQLRKEMNDEDIVKKYVKEDDKSSRNEKVLKWKLDFISRYIINRKKDIPLEGDELTRFFIRLMKTLLTPKEQKDIMFLNNDIHYNRKPSILIYIYYKDCILYYLYRDNMLTRISIDECNRLEMNGNIVYDADAIR